MQTKTLKRKCIECGKNLSIKVYPDKHYRNGHYFNKFKVPIGKGHHKKTGTVHFGKKTFDVVNWTGKEKEFEYWECDACFEESHNQFWLELNIEDLYGKRCPDHHQGCPTCSAWGVYDMIIDVDNK